MLAPLKRLIDPSRPLTYGIVQAGPIFREGYLTYALSICQMDKAFVTNGHCCAPRQISRISTDDLASARRTW